MSPTLGFRPRSSVRTRSSLRSPAAIPGSGPGSTACGRRTIPQRSRAGCSRASCGSTWDGRKLSANPRPDLRGELVPPLAVEVVRHDPEDRVPGQIERAIAARVALACGREPVEVPGVELDDEPRRP